MYLFPLMHLSMWTKLALWLINVNQTFSNYILKTYFSWTRTFSFCYYLVNVINLTLHQSDHIKQLPLYYNFLSIFLFTYYDLSLEVMNLYPVFWQNQIYIIHANSKLFHSLKAPSVTSISTPTFTTLNKDCRTLIGNKIFLDQIKFAKVQL